MHESSMRQMQRFVEEHLTNRRGQPLTILDVGSMDVNGTYRKLFDDRRWIYLGLDTASGPGVDRVVNDPYRWRQLRSRSFDVAISGQAFEHIEFPWVTILEIARVLRPGGVCCLVVPSSGPVHRFPLDCWRFYPDGLEALAHWADLEVVAAETHWEDEGWPDGSDQWHDSILVARRPLTSRPILGPLKRQLLRTVTRQQANRRRVATVDMPDTPAESDATI